MYRIVAEDGNSRARCGIVSLAHGEVETPVFMPVGTNAAVKALSHRDLEDLGFRLILANTYHLYLRPGLEVLREFGGLHSFSTWNRNILTDSGGFQVFSLSPFRKIRPEGVAFKSHIDGSSHRLTPEDVVRAQLVFGSDVLMPLDFCTPPGISHREAREASDITSLWAGRSREEWLRSGMMERNRLFGIIQGNFYKDLREKSAEEILELDFPGIAIGGLSVGESYEIFLEYLSHTAAFLPREKPRYLMGIGTPDYILAAVENGIDMFDCVFPTRIARNGTVFTSGGRIALKRETHAQSQDPIDPQCPCRVCRTYSRGYIRHLFKTREILGPMLATYHNLAFLHSFVEKIRDSIKNNTFSEFKKSFLGAGEGGDF